MRLFVAVDPGTEILERIGARVALLEKIAPNAKWARVGSLHVTLVFLGEVADDKLEGVVAAARIAAEHAAPLSLRIEGGGTFGGKKPRVLWVGVGGDVEPLARLQQEIAAALDPQGLGEDEHGFSPHLTLARARYSRGDTLLTACAEAIAAETFGETHVRDVVVYQSELTQAGARYTAIARIPLGAPVTKD